MRRLTLLTVLVASFAATSAAQAAQRYVAVGASGTCTQADPCSLATGINSASTGDEVIIAPGSYTASAVLSNGAGNLYIHGQPGVARPVISSSATEGMQFLGAQARISDIELDHTGSATALTLFSYGSKLDHVRVNSSGSLACSLGPEAIARDSLCVNAASSATALQIAFSGDTTSNKLRNVTAIATGGSSTGMSFGVGQNSSNSVDLRNVIASGTSSDIHVFTFGANASTSVSAAYSNFDVVTTSGAGVSPPVAGSATNQTAQPVFADTAFYRQASSSPTVDAGAADAETSTSDLDGDARPLGAAIDIGSDEFVPPALPPVDPVDPEDPVDPGPEGPVDPDTSAPQTSITRTPLYRRAKHSVFAFASSEPNSTFACAIDGATPKACVSGVDYTGLRAGKHIFSVVATDPAGNIDPTPATATFRIKKKRTKSARR